MKQEVEFWLLLYVGAFAEYMEKNGFTPLNEKQVLEYFLKSGRKSNPKKQGQGIEMGWIYKNGPITLFVWVSFVTRDNEFKDDDHFWIVIDDERIDDVYYLPLRRTKTLFDRAKPVVLAHKKFLDHWPTRLVGKEEQKQFLFFEPDELGCKMYKLRELRKDKRNPDRPSISMTELRSIGVSEEDALILAEPFIRNRNYVKKNIAEGIQRVPFAYKRWCAAHGIKIPKRLPEGVDREPDYNIPDRPHTYSGPNPYPNG